MAKSVFKFSGVMATIVLMGIAALIVLQYLNYRSSPGYLAEQNLKEQEKQYAEDSYGGSTPEETLALFIDALKKGDTDLASKYFVLDSQEQWREDLSVMKERGLLNAMLDDLNEAKLTNKTEGEAFFTKVDADNLSLAQLIIKKNPLNNKWKITEL